MAERTVYAELTFDDSVAFEAHNMEPVEYLETEFDKLKGEIDLVQVTIIDNDCDDWDRYLDYVFQWAFNNSGVYLAEAPLSFVKWKEELDKERMSQNADDRLVKKN